MTDRWGLAVVHGDFGTALHAESPDLWLHPPPGRFWADPFLCAGHLFYEEWVDGRGHIGVMTDFADPRPALERPFHLSYPCVFEHEGAHFMVPEQHETGQVGLYRAHQFPHDWRLETVLLDIPGVDATVFRHDGLWWMLLARQDDEPRSHLHCYWATELTGSWHAHPGNPVVRRDRLARPGGPLLRWEGRWLRPVQNRHRTYGGSLVLYEVSKLTTEEYIEREWAGWEPRTHWPYPDGLHHVSCGETATVFDAKKIVEVL